MKEKIIRATAKIISKEGLEAASTRAICTAVGITAPTLYHHFENKVAVLDAVTSHAFEKHLKHINFEKSPDDPVENLRAIWESYMEFVLLETDLYLAMVSALSHGKILDAGKFCFKELVKRFEALQAEGLLRHSATEAAQIFLCAAQGFALFLLCQKNSFGILEVGRSSRDLTLSGLLKNA